GRKAGVPVANPGQQPQRGAGPQLGPDGSPKGLYDQAAAAAAGHVLEPEGNGFGGIAIDDQDRVYGFNRGDKTIYIFDTMGNLVKATGGGPLNGVPLDAAGSHSGGVDWEGNVWLIDRTRHRIVKLNKTLDQAVLQLGTTGKAGAD